MLSYRRFGSSLNTSEIPRRSQPVPMTVRSQLLRDAGTRVVHDMGEAESACPDAHAEDLSELRDAFANDPHLVVLLVPGR